MPDLRLCAEYRAAEKCFNFAKFADFPKYTGNLVSAFAKNVPRSIKSQSIRPTDPISEKTLIGRWIFFRSSVAGSKIAKSNLLIRNKYNRLPYEVPYENKSHITDIRDTIGFSLFPYCPTTVVQIVHS